MNNNRHKKPEIPGFLWFKVEKLVRNKIPVTGSDAISTIGTGLSRFYLLQHLIFYCDLFATENTNPCQIKVKANFLTDRPGVKPHEAITLLTKQKRSAANFATLRSLPATALRQQVCMKQLCALNYSSPFSEKSSDACLL
jgi:hypothetical protein